MSNNRMLALVAILAGGLMVGACGDSVTGLSTDRSDLRDPAAPEVFGPPAIELDDTQLLHDPSGADHQEAYDEDVER